jgi:hypothetical protein
MKLWQNTRPCDITSYCILSFRTSVCV